MPAKRATTQTINDAIEALYRLHVGLVGRGPEQHERPHKPVLLLAALDLIGQGLATPERIPWSQELRSRFRTYFEVVQQRDDEPSPQLPFYHLHSEGWWQPVRVNGGEWQPLQTPPSVGDANAGTVFATLAAPVATFVVTPSDRLVLRDGLVARYFPQARQVLSRWFQEPVAHEFLATKTSAPGTDRIDDEGEARPGRSAGFRRIVQEIYDYQCAACGLRIKLPNVPDLTFVDAAHLIPFGDPEMGGNDHPSNGIALCKNHHWAMDRLLIAPCRDYRWRVRSGLAGHRSSGEKDLIELAGRPLLLPHDAAFYPSKAGLAWREARLVA
jgi:putative restriction endonuclease